MAEGIVAAASLDGPSMRPEMPELDGRTMSGKIDAADEAALLPLIELALPPTHAYKSEGEDHKETEEARALHARLDEVEPSLGGWRFEWEQSGSGDDDDGGRGGGGDNDVLTTLRVASFNTLADAYTRSHRATAGGAAALAWEHRFPRLLCAVRRARADVLALQVVSRCGGG